MVNCAVAVDLAWHVKLVNRALASDEHEVLRILQRHIVRRWQLRRGISHLTEGCFAFRGRMTQHAPGGAAGVLQSFFKIRKSFA